MEIGVIAESLANKFVIISSYSKNNKNVFIQGENYLINLLSQKIYQSRENFYSNEVENVELLKNQSLIKQLKIVSYLAAPIIINNEVYGIIHLFGKEKIKLNVNYQQDLIEATTQNIAQVIINNEAELEKEQINVALEESKDRLYNILSSLEDVIWSIHPQTLQLMYINNAAEKLYDCKLINFFQQRCFWLELINPEQREDIKEKYSCILNISLFDNQTNNHDLEYKITLPNGEQKYVRDRAYVIYDNQENRLRIDGILTDITSQKITQLALEKREEEFRILFEFAPIAMMITDLEGNILQVNNALCDLLGYTNIELINSNEATLYYFDDIEKNKLFHDKIVTEYIEQDHQKLRYLSTNSTIIYSITHVTILRNNQGKVIQLIKQIVDVSQITAMKEQILYDAYHDKLTGLANRFLLIDKLNQSLKRCNRHPNEFCAVLVIDIDNFKQINDSMGHQIGDELLIEISEKIVSCVSNKDTVARISGDQFCVLLDDLKSEEEAIAVVRKILVSCDTSHIIENYQMFSSVSIGFTSSLINYQKPEEMIRDADLTMHQAKEDGKNCYRIFNPEMYTQLVNKIQLETYLRRAINTPEFEIYYQPIMNLQTGMIAGFEALIRWFNPELGTVSPVKFIPIAEETNLIIPLGDWILITAAQQIEKWQKKYPKLSLFIAVNLSSKQLLDTDILSKIDDILVKTNIEPSLLKIEITETILMDNFDQAKKILDAFQARNLKISLDDFGTGYSSLSYLHKLPFNTLKIDRSFVMSLERKIDRTAIVEAIITLAHNLNLEVVAEGIEKTIQEQILTNLKCDYGQGYMYSKPVNVQDAEAFINSLIKVH
jgi:diguanylate cyclase (GGDEF)-like protein/PAS domain S-box-containing protein